MLLAAGATPPASVVATGSTRPAAGGGRVDWSVAAGLSGFGDRPALSATVLCTLDASTPEEVVYTGKKGTLRLHRPAHTPSRLTLSIAEGREASTDETLEFALPPVPAGATRPLRCPGSAGLRAASRDGRSCRQARSPSTTPARKALCTRRPRSTGRCARAGSRPRSGRTRRASPRSGSWTSCAAPSSGRAAASGRRGAGGGTCGRGAGGRGGREPQSER